MCGLTRVRGHCSHIIVRRGVPRIRDDTPLNGRERRTGWADCMGCCRVNVGRKCDVREWESVNIEYVLGEHLAIQIN